MDNSEYSYDNAAPSHTYAYLWEPVIHKLESAFDCSKSRRALDLGCGSGAFCKALSDRRFDVVGVDPSVQGIKHARKAYPGIDFEIASTEESLAGRFGKFPAVISLEVIEHVYAPRQFVKCAFDLLEPGGLAIFSTPYNGYWKNLAIALVGQYDKYFTALWDHGHVKFWSIKTLSQLLQEIGFEELQFKRAGRISPLAKSMIAFARKPR
jgi:2-polyprenyl-3-methyl-5-hydroxy-6-metoxy-1,4-benzoquinol methylase